MNEYLASFEQRKLEQQERRFKILFLKKLELDGAKILMSLQDRELLNNFDQPQNADEDKMIEKAMDEDYDENLTKDERKILESQK